MMPNTAWLRKYPWIWSLLMSAIIWLATGIVSSRLSIQSLIINCTLASFLAVAALGQMFAITSGGGGIDLSIPYVITLTAFVGTEVMNGENGNTILAILLCLAIGVGVGVVNSVMVSFLKIPPMVGTLAVGYIVNSAGLVYAHGFSSANPSPAMIWFMKVSVVGIPLVVLFSVLLGLIFGGVLSQTVFGKHLLAIGQSRRAAELSGAVPIRTILWAYILSGMCAALAGFLLSVYVGGAFLDMGNPYLLESIGAVVIGGTLIAGGRSTVIGTLGGSLFLTLVVTFMEVTKLPIGIQDVIEGLLVILVLLIANSKLESA